MKSIFLPPGEGRSYPTGRISALFKADGDETAKRYPISEWSHSHDEEDCVFNVIEGTMSILLGDRWIARRPPKDARS